MTLTCASFHSTTNQPNAYVQNNAEKSILYSGFMVSIHGLTLQWLQNYTSVLSTANKYGGISS